MRKAVFLVYGHLQAGQSLCKGSDRLFPRIGVFVLRERVAEIGNSPLPGICLTRYPCHAKNFSHDLS